jgi:hypothetical protein
LAVRFQDNDDIDREVTDAAIWFDGGSNYTIDHNTFLHDYQGIKACEGRQFQAENILIHHNFSNSHHRMFMEINTGNGCGNATYNAGIDNFQVYDNYDLNAGGPYPEANTFGLSAPFAQAKQPGSGVYTSIPMGEVVWYNNLLKGVVNNNQYVGIGIEVGARDLKIYKYGDVSMANCGVRIRGYGGRFYAGQLCLPHHSVAGKKCVFRRFQ